MDHNEQINKLQDDVTELKTDVREIKTILIEREKHNEEIVNSVKNQFTNVCPVRENRLQRLEFQAKVVWFILAAVASGTFWLIGVYISNLFSHYFAK